MKMKRSKKTLSFILCMVLLVAMAQFTTGCNDKTNKDNPVSVESEVQILGEGSTVFPLGVVEKDGNVTNFEIHTDKTMVGEALVDLGLIEGENGDYGLYVKKVNGITADYDTDGVYWAFYVNGEYAQTGVDVTEIKEGDNYTFKVE